MVPITWWKRSSAFSTVMSKAVLVVDPSLGLRQPQRSAMLPGEIQHRKARSLGESDLVVVE
jgi:hypothetical protein